MKSKLTSIIVTFVVAAMALSGCSSDETDISFLETDTIAAVMSEVDEYTSVDERLDNPEFTELLSKYEEYRASGNVGLCNDMLELIGTEILKAAVAENLDIPSEDITSFSVSSEVTGHSNGVKISYNNFSSETVSGNIVVDKQEEIHEEYDLAGEGANIAINLDRAAVRGWEEDELDAVYESYMRFLLTSGNLKEKFLGNATLDFAIDQEKTKTFTKK